MKVALVHDDLVQWGGAERVLQALTEIFPDAPIFTSVCNFENPELLKAFGTKNVYTSFMQKIPGWKNIYRPLLPLYPIAFEQFDFSAYDVVISQTTRFAKSIVTKPKTLHICYCHTPPRFLWNFSDAKDYSPLSLYFSFLRMYDRISAKRADYFIAGSENAGKRIEQIYKIDAPVCQPFVEVSKYSQLETFSGDYYLIISRLVSYKKVGIAVDYFNKKDSLNKKLIVVGVGPELEVLRKRAGKNIEFLGRVSEGLRLSLIAGCKALIVTAEEDFGMTALEAKAAGKPVVAFGKGGAKETVVDGITGTFFYEQTADSLAEAISRLESLTIKPENCIRKASEFSREKFKHNFLEIMKQFQI